MERDVTMIIKMPADMLTDFRLFTVTRGGEIADVRTEETKTKKHPIRTKEEYIGLFEKRKRQLEELFDETATAEEIVGFFLYHEGENALKELKEYIDPEKVSRAEEEAIRILGMLGYKD